MNIKPIRNDQDYEEALLLLGTLVSKDPEPESEDGDKLSILSTLVEKYEASRYPETLPSPIEAIKFRMEQANLKPVDLIPYIGSRSKVSEVLAGKRPLSLKMIRALDAGLGIPAKVLIQKPEAAKGMAMATQSSRSDEMSALSNQVAKLLRGYERFELQADIPGLNAVYIMSLRSSVMVHRKHTQKGLFVPNEVYQAASLSALPRFEYIEAWLPQARAGAEKLINKGDFTIEKIINGEWQSVKAKYNQWIYYDHKNHATIGTVQVIDLQPSDRTSDTERANAPSNPLNKGDK